MSDSVCNAEMMRVIALMMPEWELIFEIWTIRSDYHYEWKQTDPMHVITVCALASTLMLQVKQVRWVSSPCVRTRQVWIQACWERKSATLTITTSDTMKQKKTKVTSYYDTHVGLSFDVTDWGWQGWVQVGNWKELNYALYCAAKVLSQVSNWEFQPKWHIW
jgi:hypothetical protein